MKTGENNCIYSKKRPSALSQHFSLNLDIRVINNIILPTKLFLLVLAKEFHEFEFEIFRCYTILLRKANLKYNGENQRQTQVSK